MKPDNGFYLLQEFQKRLEWVGFIVQIIIINKMSASYQIFKNFFLL